MIEDSVKIAENVILGKDVRLFGWANLYGCEIGDYSSVGPFVEIQCDVRLGRKVKVQSHTFICSGVQIADEVFIGHGVMFINDRLPFSTNADGSLKKEGDWTLERTIVEHRASIGSNSTILCGVIIGEGAIVGAGAVVTKDVPAKSIVAGNPARIIESNIKTVS